MFGHFLFFNLTYLMSFVKCRYCAAGLTLHSVARDGVKVVNTSGNGNAVTCISISEGKGITLCKGTSFAKAYNSNDSCVEYANKASAYSGSGVGSGTRGIYINSNGKPKAMTYCLGKDVPSGMQIICSVSSPLDLDPVSKALSINIADSTHFLSADDTKAVTAKAILTYLRNNGVKNI